MHGETNAQALDTPAVCRGPGPMAHIGSLAVDG